MGCGVAIAFLKLTLERSLAHLGRAGELPLGDLIRKGVGYLVSMARAQMVLSEFDALGPAARVTGSPRIVKRGHISAGEGFRLTSTWSPVELVAGPEGRIEIGHRVAINFGTSIRADKLVRIEDSAMIGQYCILADTEVPERLDGAALPKGRVEEPRPIVIGKGAWLAGRVTVMPGVTIGAGSVVTAGSVVWSDVPPGVIAGGVPARVLRRLDTAAAAAETAGAPAPGREPSRPDRKVEFRGLVLADFTIGDLVDQLANSPEEPGLAVEQGPFGQVVQQLLQGVPASQADFVVVWTRPEAALPSFAAMLAHQEATEKQLRADVDTFAALVTSGCKAQRAAFVPSWTLPPWQRGLGMLDGRPGGTTRALALANLCLAEALAAAPNLYVLSAQRWIDAGGRNAHTAKGWYLGKVPFSAEVFAEAARDVKAALLGLLGRARRLVIVDLDDTLWGGIVGDVGWQGLRLGGHDGAGEAYVDFQRGLKALTRRGILLGVVSKNSEQVALTAIQSRPEMVLKRSDFVGYRINWEDKARNIADLVAELNLGLQSVVFIDDNPAERARVRETLPEVLVPDWPADPLLYPSALAGLRCFDVPALSKEDAARTKMYADEQQREALRAQITSLDEWLKTLGTMVRVEPLGPANLTRAAQLFNKTNQLNLATRRLTEAELITWAGGLGRALYTITVSDRFGDAGLTGIVSVERDGDCVRLVDFLLSCRVMGRRIEQSMIHVAVEQARRWGARRLEIKLLPTARNQPAREVLGTAGLTAAGEDQWTWDASAPYSLPEAIRLEQRP